jgi:hypothetical protein
MKVHKLEFSCFGEIRSSFRAVTGPANSSPSRTRSLSHRSFHTQHPLTVMMLRLRQQHSNSTQHDEYPVCYTCHCFWNFLVHGIIERSKLHASMTTGVAARLTADKAKGNVDYVLEKRVHLFSRLKEGDTDGAIAILRSVLGSSRV